MTDDDVGAGRDPQRDADIFTDLVDEHIVRPLAQFGLARYEARVLDPGMWVKLRNATTEVSVYFEYGSGLLLSFRHLDATTGAYTGENFGMDDLLGVRAPHRIRPFPRRGVLISTIAAELEQHGTDLRDYAEDVLRGDFAIYAMVKPIMDERRKRNERAFEGR